MGDDNLSAESNIAWLPTFISIFGGGTIGALLSYVTESNLTLSHLKIST